MPAERTAPPPRGVTAEPFGALPDGRRVMAYTLRAGGALVVRIADWGGRVLSILAPDRAGRAAEVTLGYDDLAGYLADRAYFGALVGRHANRIARGRFALDGRTYALATNDGPNHLHGGAHGFDRRLWVAERFERAGAVGLVLARVSADGEEGYPGRLDVRVTCTLTDDDTLAFDYEAATDAPTPVNLTQHAYFNLTGDARRDVLGHRLTIHASRFTPVDAALIPTGELRAVAGTPFDFTRPTPVGARLDADDPQLRHGGGYDHNWALDRPAPEAAGDGALAPAVRLVEPESGRALEVRTNEPGLQFYAGNQLDGSVVGRGGVAYGRHAGLALETQRFPDSPNQPRFPPAILRPGETYRSRTVYRFFVSDGA